MPVSKYGIKSPKYKNERMEMVHESFVPTPGHLLINYFGTDNKNILLKRDDFSYKYYKPTKLDSTSCIKML